MSPGRLPCATSSSMWAKVIKRNLVRKSEGKFNISSGLQRSGPTWIREDLGGKINTVRDPKWLQRSSYQSWIRITFPPIGPSTSSSKSQTLQLTTKSNVFQSSDMFCNFSSYLTQKPKSSERDRPNSHFLFVQQIREYVFCIFPPYVTFRNVFEFSLRT